MSKKYEIKTVADLVAAAKDSGNTDALVADIGVWLGYATGETTNAIMDFPGISFDDSQFVWVDDGNSGVSAVNVEIKS